MEENSVVSEVRIKQRKSVPIHAEGIGTRISDVAKLHGSRKSAAESAGITPDTLHRYIREAVSPSFESIAGLALPVGVSLDWMATGKGPKFIKEQEAQRFDVEMLQKSIETLEKGLEMTGRVVNNAGDKAHLIAMVYDYLTDDSKDASGRSDSVLRLLQIVK